MNTPTDPTDSLISVDLDQTGWLVDADTAEPVAEPYLHDYFAEQLAPPSWATDIIVNVHGWQTSPASAAQAAGLLQTLSRQLFETAPNLYPRLDVEGFRPWTIVVRWPSSSLITPRGYRRIRDRAHAMGATANGGHAAHIIGQLLGYLDAERPDPTDAQVLANREGQFLHLIGHSFGCRVLCEAVQWAAEASLGDTLGWTSSVRLSSRPFTADSMLLFQMAAPRDIFMSAFGSLLPSDHHDGAPLRGPIVMTYSRNDRAVGFWHKRAEGQFGIGHSGMGAAPLPTHTTRMRPVGERYSQADIDHRFVSVDSTNFFVRGRFFKPAGAHSAHVCPESAHLLLSLADYSR